MAEQHVSGAGSSPEPPDDAGPAAHTPEEAMDEAGAGSSPDDADGGDDRDERASRADDDGASNDEVDEADEEYQRLLGKHKGDKGALARDVFETKRSARVTFEENRALRESLTEMQQQIEELRTGRSRGTDVDEDDATVDDSPDTDMRPEDAEDLKWFQTEVASLNAEVKANADRQTEIINELDKERVGIARLEGKLEVTSDDTEGDRLRREIKEKRDEYNAKVKEYKDLGRDTARVQRDLHARQKDLTAVERRMKARQAQAKDAQKQQVAFNARVRGEFAAAAQEAADELGFDAKTPEAKAARAKFVEKLRSSVIIKLRQLHASGNRNVNLARVINDEVEDAKDVILGGRRKSFGNYSREKLDRTAREVPRERAARVVPPSKKDEDDPAYWKRRAAQILP